MASSIDKHFMQRCLQLASAGEGSVAPNPLVGAVIVHENKIIGEGYHRKFGEAHAEVNAVHSVDNKELLKESTIYVSLEPCAHFGKTPPCADLLIKHQFKRVVVANRDPFDAVNGKGIERLMASGIEVELGVLEDEGRELNRRFFTFHEKKRPFVILKWAQSINGVMGVEGMNTWISAPETRKLVHLWRAREQAILVGRKTVEMDDPELTVRDVHGANPTRIVLDPHLRLHSKYRVFNGEAPTFIANGSREDLPYLKIDLQQPIPSLLNHLYHLNLSSLIVEGGATLVQSFIEAGLWDEARVITGQKTINNGIQAPKVSGRHIERFSFGDDVIDTYRL